MRVVENGLNPSMHCPLRLELGIPLDRLNVHLPKRNVNRVAWHRVGEREIDMYQVNICDKLKSVHIPTNTLLCCDVMCSLTEHKQSLSQYCRDLIEVCIKVGRDCFPVVQNRKSNLPFWNENIKSLKKGWSCC